MTLFSDDHHHSHPTLPFFLLLSSLKSSLSSSFFFSLSSFLLFLLFSYFFPQVINCYNTLFSPRSFFFHSLFVHNENEILGHSTNMSHILCDQRWIARSGDRFNSHPLNQSLSLLPVLSLNSSLPFFQYPSFLLPVSFLSFFQYPSFFLPVSFLFFYSSSTCDFSFTSFLPGKRRKIREQERKMKRELF